MTRRWVYVVPAVVAFTAAVLGIGVRATYGGQASVDEPQYLLTALSLYEDRSLDISDELAAERWRDYYDRELPVQTRPLPDGSALSPHDPLLPVLIAVPVGLGGWVGAKIALGLVAAACAALLVWTAVRRFGLDARVAAAGAALVFASPPLGIYSQQVYPELPAALATLAAVAALTRPVLRGRELAIALTAVVALPWLGVKYAPVAIALVAMLAWRLRCQRPRLLVAGAVLAAAGASYLLLHRQIWGGWTVYATGDHFQQTGEFSVMGVEPDYWGRSLRLVSLFTDRGYGLIGWQPAYLLLVPAVIVLLTRRLPARELLVPLGAGWAAATWLALTMHGYWSPGRQVVVVLPLAVLVVLAAMRETAVRPAAPAVLALAGVVNLVALWFDGYREAVTWVTGFERVHSPVYRALAPLLPDYRWPGFWPGHLIWIAVLTGTAVLTYRATRRRPAEAVPTDVLKGSLT
ncbi:MAG: hypothetical protein ACRDP9_09120 [Kribbellaceae bacterium]